MATISSLGIGSGLDVESIITKLVALEKQPLTTLQTKATLESSQITAFGQIQSQVSALADASTAMSTALSWQSKTASSSNTSAATVTVTSAASATSFTLDVDSLAKQQSVASATVPTGAAVGAGTLTFQLGIWAASGASFAPGAAGSVDIAVTDTDTVATLASKINQANMGVVATVFNDGTQDRLLLHSKSTGAAAGFRVQASVDADTNPTDSLGLSRFAFDPAGGATYGMADPAIPIQYGEDAKARINGLAVTSASNTLTGNLAGVTINLLATTTTNYGQVNEAKVPVSMNVSEDVTVAVKNVQAFVTAYNALATNLTSLTKYNASTNSTSLFQGDSTILGIQSVLRNITGSISAGSSAYARLSDVGLERQLDGTLSINTTKLSAAANNGSELQKLFTTDNSNTLTNGFALKFKNFSQGALLAGGAVSNKALALQKVLDNNAKEQARITTRAATVEASLRKQYSALDSRMASLTALSSYVTQQVTTWNKSTA
jgi:flagellar hook-associated protein 2